MKKIAICFSGHLRNFLVSKKESKLLQDVEKIKSTGTQVDFFFSIWKTYNGTSARYNKKNAKYYKVPEESNREPITPKILSAFNPIKVEIEDYSSVEPTFNVARISQKMADAILEDNTYVGPMNQKNGYLYSTPMFYKMYKANELKKIHEKENGFNYDVVVKYRANIDLENEFAIDFDSVQDGCLYVSGSGWEGRSVTGNAARMFGYGHESIMMQDMFFYANSSTMDKVCNLYNNLKKIYEEHGTTSPERIFYDWVVLECKACPKENPIKFKYTYE